MTWGAGFFLAVCWDLALGFRIYPFYWVALMYGFCLGVEQFGR
jgi:hypothetical protein